MKRLMLIAYAAIFTGTLAAAVWYPEREEKVLDDAFQSSANPEQERCRDYQARLDACTHRLEARHRIARKLIDGRLSLLEAADRYRDLNEATGDFDWYGFRHFYPGACDDERTCWQVITASVGVAGENTSQALAVKERLQKELDQHLQRGALCIPR
jgi:hypothetical protein